MTEKDEITKNFDGVASLKKILDSQERRMVKKVTPRILSRKGRDNSYGEKSHDSLPLFSTKTFTDFSKIISEDGLRKFSDAVKEAKEIAKFGVPEEICDVTIPHGYEIVEKYWVYKPFVMVHILYNKNTNEYLYYLVEPKLGEDEAYILTELKELVKTRLLYGKVEGSNKDETLEKTVEKVMEEYGIKVGRSTFHKFLYYLKRDFIGFYKIDGIMRDPYVEDVSCDGWDIPIFVYHWHYGNIPTNIKMARKELDPFVIKLAQRSGKHISTSNPMVDATLSDGSRIQLTLGKEVTARGSTFTIRKFKEVLITPVDLIRWNTFSVDEMAYLWLAAENGKSMLFVGGTASGKTTSLNAVALFIPPNAKIITIEDTRELKLPHPNWIPSVTRDSFAEGERGRIEMYDLLKAALRQRPEYIIVGEVRGKEALTLFQAMSTGHTTLSTFHADSVEAAIHRLEYPPLSVPRSMISALDIVCVQAQTFVKRRRVRRNLKIVEITEIDPATKNIKTMDIFQWDPSADSHRFLLNDFWNSRIMEDIMTFKAWNEKELAEELEMRKEILKSMIERSVTSDEFIKFMKAFHANPEEAVKEFLGDRS